MINIALFTLPRMSKTVVVVGSGGREHAIVWKLAQSPHLKRIVVCPGNGGTASMKHEKITIENYNATKEDDIAAYCAEQKVDLVIVGPEVPLSNGLADKLAAAKIPCFGPSAKASQIEASKSFAKDFMIRHNIPTAQYKTFTSSQSLEEIYQYIDSLEHNVVVKASGLAAGKGVIVPANKQEAKDAVKDIMQNKIVGSAGETVVLEEALSGEEISLLAFSDGKHVISMPTAQDHKRVHDGDKGPNTGGMGAFAPVPDYESLRAELTAKIIEPAVKGLAAEGIPFVGVLFAGLMMTEKGPIVLEFNCRFGDPETQVILPLLKSDLFDIVSACVNGTLDTLKVQWHSNLSAATVVLASAGYPGSYPSNKPITGLCDESSDVVIFQAGTQLNDGHLLTSGGRVLAVTAVHTSLNRAAGRAYEVLEHIKFEGAQYRKDIAQKSFKPLRLAVLGSTRGTDMQAIIDAINANELNAEIRIVLSNKSDAYILTRAREHNLPCKYIPLNNLPREKYDAKLMEYLDGIDMILLIGWMRILAKPFVEHFKKLRVPMVNVHPSLLPDFKGLMDLAVHKAVLDSGKTETGCSVHLIEPEVDAGQVVVQPRCAVDAADTPESLKAKVQALEGPALITAIRMAQQGRLDADWKTSTSKVSLSYKDAGVDIAAQDELVERIKPLAKSTRRIGTDAALGGFGCLFDVSKTHFKDPILVSKTDGVGTKLKLAQQMGVHHTVGIDLVAMSVNDVLCQGAEPLFFLDYFACASLNIDEGYQVVKGIADGCLLSGCSLIGGETAEMPGMYQPGEYDLAGFAVGAVEREQMLPKLDSVVPGDVVLGLSSSGIHSNGYSLVRKIISVNKIDLHQPPPFASKHQRIGDVLLEPTKIYVKPVLPLIQDQTIKALAHITGGGLPENIPRVVPSNVQVDLDLRSWPLPPIYKWLISLGKFSADDLLKTWNMGIGLVIVVAADKLEHVRKVLKEHGEESYIIGHVSARQPSEYKGEDAPVFVHNSEALFE